MRMRSNWVSESGSVTRIVASGVRREWPLTESLSSDKFTTSSSASDFPKLDVVRKKFDPISLAVTRASVRMV